MEMLKRKLTTFVFITIFAFVFTNFLKPNLVSAQVGTGGCRSDEVDTAIGCIPVGGEQGTRNFVDFLLGWGVGIAGGIAFILIVIAGLMMITSGGDPKRMQAGKELLTAAVSGLLFLIFGAFILRFVGVDILNIPGFGR